MKVSVIQESASYDTLIVDELFSKLKSTKINLQTQTKMKNPTAPIMTLISGTSGSRSSTNPSQPAFALSSLVSMIDEQMDYLGDDELALIISKLLQFHNNYLNR